MKNFTKLDDIKKHVGENIFDFSPDEYSTVKGIEEQFTKIKQFPAVIFYTDFSDKKTEDGMNISWTTRQVFVDKDGTLLNKTNDDEE